MNNINESPAIFKSNAQTDVILGACYIKICRGFYAMVKIAVCPKDERQKRSSNEERPAEPLRGGEERYTIKNA